MGWNTWASIGKPLPNRLNIVLSRSHSIERQPNVLLMKTIEEVLALSKYLSGDLFIIGGAETYKNFADQIEKWIVTRVPESVEGADAFMPRNFLEGFGLTETRALDETLKAEFYERNK